MHFLDIEIAQVCIPFGGRGEERENKAYENGMYSIVGIQQFTGCDKGCNSVTCMKPPLYQNFISEVLALVVAREQGFTPQTNLPTRYGGEGVITHIWYGLQPSLYCCNWNPHCSHHREYVGNGCKAPSTTFCKTCISNNSHNHSDFGRASHQWNRIQESGNSL